MLGSMEKLFAKAPDSSADDDNDSDVDDDNDDDDLGMFRLLGTLSLGEEIESMLRDGESHAITVNKKKDTYLHVAARTKNPAFAKLMIEEGAAVDAQNTLGQTPLLIAIKKDAVEVVELLVEAGASVDLQDDRGSSPAAMIGQRHWATREILEYFLKKLHSNCPSGKEEMAKKLIEHDWSLLHVVKLGDAELTKFVLQSGHAKDINEMDDDYSGQTALHVAVKFADIENVKLLLENEANVNVKDFEDRTPLSYAYDDTDKFLDERFDIVNMLIDRGATLISSDDEYDIDVLEIFLYGTREAIGLILQSAVDLTVASDEFKSVLVYSLAANEHPGAIEELRGRMIIDVDVDLPLIVAARYGNAGAVEFLLDEGADVNNVDAKNISAIHSIFQCCSESLQLKYRDCVLVLLQRGASVELKTDNDEKLTVLDIVFREKLLLMGQLVLCHLALQENMGRSISELVRARIDEHSEFKSYFESSKRQLSMEICQSVTLFDLLTATDKKLELCVMGNEELVSQVPEFLDVLSDYYYFRSLLQKRLAKALLKHKTAQIICKIVGPSYDSFPAVVDKIVNCLESQDMDNLMDAYS